MKYKSLGVFYLQFNCKHFLFFRDQLQTLCYKKLLNTLHKDEDEVFSFFFFLIEMQANSYLNSKEICRVLPFILKKRNMCGCFEGDADNWRLKILGFI